jgi:hypothetical protein
LMLAIRQVGGKGPGSDDENLESLEGKAVGGFGG